MTHRAIPLVEVNYGKRFGTLIKILIENKLSNDILFMITLIVFFLGTFIFKSQFRVRVSLDARI